MAIAVSVCAALGTFLDAFLVARTRGYCLGDLNAVESFSASIWPISRLIVFPVISGISLLAALPVILVAHLPWFADHGWLRATLTALAVLVSITGPAATIIHDVATEGITGDCDPPWWPCWLPS